jgi:hypothetical protein
MALQRTPLQSLPVEDRPYLEVAIALASVGDTVRAHALLMQYEKVVDAPGQLRTQALAHHARGMLAFARHRMRDAVGEFVQAADALCNICGLPELGLAWERLGQPDSARATYLRYVETRSARRLDMTDAWHGMRVVASLDTLRDQHTHTHIPIRP